MSKIARFRYSVSYEFDYRPVQTHEGVIQAHGAHVAVSRAVKAAHAALRPIMWRSLVVCLLEKVPDDEPSKK